MRRKEVGVSFSAKNQVDSPLSLPDKCPRLCVLNAVISEGWNKLPWYWSRRLTAKAQRDLRLSLSVCMKNWSWLYQNLINCAVTTKLWRYDNTLYWSKRLVPRFRWHFHVWCFMIVSFAKLSIFITRSKQKASILRRWRIFFFLNVTRRTKNIEVIAMGINRVGYVVSRFYTGYKKHESKYAGKSLLRILRLLEQQEWESSWCYVYAPSLPAFPCDSHGSMIA